MKKVLILEKDIRIGEVLAEALDTTDHWWLMAISEEQALMLVRDPEFFEGNMDRVVVIDYDPHNEHDGIELVGRIRKHCEENGLPMPGVVLMSSHHDHLLAATHLVGAEPLPKPFTMPDFLCAIERAVIIGQFPDYQHLIGLQSSPVGTTETVSI